MDAQLIIESSAIICANDGIRSGLTSEHLSAGWNLERDDWEYIAEQLGRELTSDEQDTARAAFEMHIRRNA